MCWNLLIVGASEGGEEVWNQFSTNLGISYVKNNKDWSNMLQD